MSLDISEGLACKGYGPAALDEGHTEAVLASISLHYDRLGSVIVCQGSVEKCLADPGL